MADDVPVDGQIAQRAKLVARLLQFVLAEIRDAGCVSMAQHVSGNGFRHRQQPYLFGRASGTEAGGRNPLLHILQISGECLGGPGAKTRNVFQSEIVQRCLHIGTLPPGRRKTGHDEIASLDTITHAYQEIGWAYPSISETSPRPI